MQLIQLCHTTHNSNSSSNSNNNNHNNNNNNNKHLCSNTNSNNSHRAFHINISPTFHIHSSISMQLHPCPSSPAAVAGVDRSPLAAHSNLTLISNPPLIIGPS